MRRKRLITLHNPKLIAFRSNLRTILWNYYYDQKSILKAHWLGAEGEKKREFLKKIEELRESFERSIVICSICSKSDGDRVFYPRLNMWFCKDCLDKGIIPTKRDLS